MEPALASMYGPQYMHRYTLLYGVLGNCMLVILFKEIIPESGLDKMKGKVFINCALNPLEREA